MRRDTAVLEKVTARLERAVSRSDGSPDAEELCDAVIPRFE